MTAGEGEQGVDAQMAQDRATVILAKAVVEIHRPSMRLVEIQRRDDRRQVRVVFDARNSGSRRRTGATRV